MKKAALILSGIMLTAIIYVRTNHKKDNKSDLSENQRNT